MREETGLEIGAKMVPEHFIEVHVKEQRTKLFIITDVSALLPPVWRIKSLSPALAPLVLSACPVWVLHCPWAPLHAKDACTALCKTQRPAVRSSRACSCLA